MSLGLSHACPALFGPALGRKLCSSSHPAPSFECRKESQLIKESLPCLSAPSFSQAQGGGSQGSGKAAPNTLPAAPGAVRAITGTSIWKDTEENPRATGRALQRRAGAKMLLFHPLFLHLPCLHPSISMFLV